MATARVVRPLVTPRRDGVDRSRHLRVVRPSGPGWGLRLSPRAGVLLTVLAFAALFAVAASHALLIEGQAGSTTSTRPWPSSRPGTRS